TYGGTGQDGLGGGIYSSGWLKLIANTTVENNLALGGRGGPGSPASGVGGAIPAGVGGTGGAGLGGGLYVAGGTVDLTDTAVSIAGNAAQGGQGGGGGQGTTRTPAFGPTYQSGDGGQGGAGEGGGVYVAGGNVTLNKQDVFSNTVLGGAGG